MWEWKQKIYISNTFEIKKISDFKEIKTIRQSLIPKISFQISCFRLFLETGKPVLIWFVENGRYENRQFHMTGISGLIGWGTSLSSSCRTYRSQLVWQVPPIHESRVVFFWLKSWMPPCSQFFKIFLINVHLPNGFLRRRGPNRN